MKSIKDILNNLTSLIGKRVLFTSDCEIFPINEVCKVLRIDDTNTDEKLIKVRIIKNNKIIQIGTNMSHLKYKILSV